MAGVKVGSIDIQFGATFEQAKANQLVQLLQQVASAINTLAKIQATPVAPPTTVPLHVLADQSGLGADHSTSGLEPGEVLRAFSATNARFDKVKFSDLAQSDIPDNPGNLQILQFLNGYWSSVALPPSTGAQDADNIGIGRGWYVGKVDVTLQFKSIAQGANVALADDGETITVSAADAPVPIRGATFSGGGSVITVPTEDVPLTLHEDCRIVKVVLLTSGGVGSCQLDVLRGTYAAYPTAASLCGAALPTVNSDVKSVDATLVGWTTDLNADDILLIRLLTSSTFKTIALSLYLAPR